MRIAVQVPPDALHADRASRLRYRCGPSWRIAYPFRNGHKLRKATATKHRTRVGCWLFALLVPGVLALAQPSTEVTPVPVLQSAPNLQQAVANQLWAENTLAQPRRRALPPIRRADPSSPNRDACANRVTGPEDRRWQTEWAFGKKQAAVLEKRANLITDPAITEYLNRLEQAIVRNSDLRGCFVVKLVNDVEANAYSLPGGFLYVTTGLILNSNNEAELVAALAHETGHVTARHFTKIEARRRNWKRFSLAGGPAGFALGWRIGPLFTFKLLRNAEFEADQLALKYQAASGYDPIELAHLLQDVFQQEGKPASFFTRLFDTHPSTDTRIKRVTQATGRLLSQTDYVVDTSEFHEVKKQVADVVGVPNPDLHPPGEANCGSV